MAKGKSNKIVHSVRYLAMEILTAIEVEGAYSNILLNATIEKEKLDAKDAGLLTTIVYGVTQRRMTLDYGLTSFIKKPEKMQKWVVNLLRLSAYQMQYLDKIPDHAVLFDAVEIGKKKGHVGIAKLVNGVLRNIQREGLLDWQEITNPVKRISIGASVPEWLVVKFTKELGTDKAESLFFSLLEAPYVSVRVQNPAEIEAIIEELQNEGKEVVLIGIGKMVSRAVEVADELKKDGVNATVINARFLKPFDEETILNAAYTYEQNTNFKENKPTFKK